MRLLRILDTVVMSPLADHLMTAWRGMMGLLLPSPCALCVWSDAQQHQLCEACATLLKDHTSQLFQAQEFADGLPLDLVTGRPLPVFAASFYTPEMSQVVLQLKDHQRIGIAGFFHPVVFRTLRYAAEYLGYPYYRLVPIPSSGASQRKRGYNPVTTLLPRELPANLRYDGRLLKTRWQVLPRVSHHGTGIQARRELARKKFRLARRRQDPAEPIVLVDDVLTTGATLAAATRTLQAAGFDVVAAVVLTAVTPRN